MSANRKPDVPVMMTVEEYLGWSVEARPKWELHCGHPVQMQSESAGHGDVQFAIRAACKAALSPEGPCRPKEGPGVLTASDDIRIPDVYIDCAPDDDIRKSLANEPVVVFEVSVTSIDYDMGSKRGIYFNNPHVQHYVVVVPETRAVFHWRRGIADPVTLTHTGALALSPKPGITLDITAFWAELP
jgi:Uma2 family endonuclease